MIMRHRLGWLAGVMLAAIALTLGCGGGEDEGGGGGPPLPVGTAVLRGAVIAADEVTTRLPNALVSVLGTGRSQTADAAGNFEIRGLPGGQYTVEAQTPNQSNYGTTRVVVTLVEGETTTVNLAVLPEGVPQPVEVTLDPLAAVVDLNGRVRYRSQVLGQGGVVLEGVMPTWVVDGGIGTVTPDGLFIAQRVGDGSVIAYAGAAQRRSTVQVTAPAPPQVSSFQLDPRSLGAGGGDVYMSAAISDGDGIRLADVQFEILGPGDQRFLVPVTVPNPESAEPCDGQPGCYSRATFAAIFTAPANDNRPTEAGVQAPEYYSARVLVTDRAGQSTATPFIDFEVRGVDQPPPLPGI